jgi:hypothetical protein
MGEATQHFHHRNGNRLSSARKPAAAEAAPPRVSHRRPAASARSHFSTQVRERRVFFACLLVSHSAFPSQHTEDLAALSALSSSITPERIRLSFEALDTLIELSGPQSVGEEAGKRPAADAFSPIPQRTMKTIRNELYDAVFSAELTAEADPRDAKSAQLVRLPFASLCARLQDRLDEERQAHKSVLAQSQSEVGKQQMNPEECSFLSHPLLSFDRQTEQERLRLDAAYDRIGVLESELRAMTQKVQACEAEVAAAFDRGMTEGGRQQQLLAQCQNTVANMKTQQQSLENEVWKGESVLCSWPTICHTPQLSRQTAEILQLKDYRIQHQRLATLFLDPVKPSLPRGVLGGNRRAFEGGGGESHALARAPPCPHSQRPTSNTSSRNCRCT